MKNSADEKLENLDEKTQTEVSLRRFDVASKAREEERQRGPRRDLLPVLRVIEGELKGEHLVLEDDKTLLGRGQDCVWGPKDPKLSRKHAEIIVERRSPLREQFCVVIVDMGSRNGIRINGRKLEGRMVLKNGDRIKMGSHVFGFYLKFPEEVELENFLYRLATRDATTGLLSRAFFMSTLEFETKRAVRYHRPLSFVLMDIDHFKKINDTYGHPMGDEVLGEVGRLLSHTLRFEDTAARYGGEEFAVILPETALGEAQVLVERLRSLLETIPFQFGDQCFHVTASFGLAQIDAASENPSILIKAADEALYKAKENGRNRWVVAKSRAS